MARQGIQIHNGKVKIPYAVQRLDLEIEGGVDIDYYHKLKVTSTDALALVNKVMAGLVAQCAMSEGAVSGALSRISAIHGYLEVYNAGISGGARSALATLQILGAAGQTVDAGVDVLGGAHTITDLIRLTSGTIVNVMNLIAVANVVDIAESGDSGTKAGYLKITAGGAVRYIRIYDAGN